MRLLAFVFLAMPLAAQDSPVKDLAWLVGTWNGSGEKAGLGAVTEKAVVAWTLGGTLLQADLEVKSGDRVVGNERHLLGFDPEKKKLSMWSFGQDGSVGRGWLAATSTRETWIWEGTFGVKEMVFETRLTMKRIGENDLEITFEKKKDGAWTAGGALKTQRHVVDRSTPKGVVEAWVEAAKKLDKDAMLALFTPEGAEKERTWKKSFTTAMFTGGWQLKKAEVRDAEGEGDTMTVSVGAKFKTPEREEDPEGLRFQLVKKDGGWWISKLE